jgi:putative redox protein
LIGHSLGGAAVLAAAQQLPSVMAVATIAAPATADHVRHLFGAVARELETEGEAVARIGDRTFAVRRQLLDDLDRYNDASHLADLGRALLVFHSPVDTVVGIDEAAKIYQAARHPKSFISLDDADHLLSRRDDAEYVAETLVAWASRYLGLGRHAFEASRGSAPEVAHGDVLITELDRRFLRGTFTAGHQGLSDEPLAVGGTNLGPSPYDLLLMALGSCTSMTLRMYANRKRLAVDDIRVRLRHERVHADDCRDCAESDRRVERITREVTVRGDLSDAQRERLLQIADRCPVHRTLAAGVRIVTVPADADR